MGFALTILQHTPWYIFALFGGIAALGIQATKTRVISILRSLVTPAVFIGWGVISVALQSLSSPAPIVSWIIAALAGAAIGWMTMESTTLLIDRARGVVALPGSKVPLIRNLSIFAVKYALGVVMVLAPALHSELAVLDIAVSGLSAGYFLGWVARFLSAYRRAAYPLLVAQSQT
jgi:hypothetical protein